MTELAIREMVVDFAKLIKMNLNRQEWGKEYTLFTNGTLTINCIMTSFDFERDIANFAIRGNYKYGCKRSFSATEAYHRSNMTLEQFRIVLFKCIARHIEWQKDEMLKIEAEAACEDERYDYEGKRDYEMINDAGLDDDFESCSGMSSRVQDSVRDALYSEARVILDEPFYNAVSKYINEHTIDIPELDMMLTRLNDLIKTGVEKL